MTPEHYHAHITVPAFSECPSSWKETSIVLESSQEVSDLMYTKHFVIGKKNLTSLNDVIEQCKIVSETLKAIRIKIEQEDNLYLPITEEHYVEVHALISDQSAVLPEQWRRSRNARSVGERGKMFFYTRRFREGTHPEVINQVNLDLNILKSEGVLHEVKIEQIVLDTNLEHDRWWA
jgi:hypothetical protein